MKHKYITEALLGFDSLMDEPITNVEGNLHIELMQRSSRKSAVLQRESTKKQNERKLSIQRRRERTMNEYCE